MIIAKDSVTFQNDAEKEMSFSIKSIKKIIDNTGTIIYQPTSPKTASDIINKDTTIIKNVVIAEKLQYKSTSKKYLMHIKVQMSFLLRIFINQLEDL